MSAVAVGDRGCRSIGLPASDARTLLPVGRQQQNHFKGNNSAAANVDKGTGDWFDYFAGTISGWVRLEIDGVEAYGPSLCVPGSKLDKCVAILPIATNDPPGNSDAQELQVVAYAAFYITQVNDNTHNGRLLDTYLLTNRGEEGWTRDDNGIAVIRLTA